VGALPCAGRACTIRQLRHGCPLPHAMMPCQHVPPPHIDAFCLPPQVATKLYSSPLFRPAWAPLAEALLAMLLSRLYTAAQDDLSDSLFALAAANWTEFLLVSEQGKETLPSRGAQGFEAGALNTCGNVWTAAHKQARPSCIDL